VDRSNKLYEAQRRYALHYAQALETADDEPSENFTICANLVGFLHIMRENFFTL
jgi:hypothetical protein